jgi:hypothetical protein
LGDLPDIEAAALLGAFTKMNVEAEMHEVLEFFMGEHIVPKDITAEQQKLFAVINAAFSAEINNILPDLKRMPTGEEYQTLLSAIQSNMVLKNFMHEYHEAHKSEMVKFTDAQKQKMKEEKEKFAAQQRKVAEVEAEEAEATEAFVVNYDAIPPLESEVAGNSLEELDHL